MTTDLPSDIDAEKGIIGSIFCDPDKSLPEVSEHITPAHIHSPALKTILTAIMSLWEARKAVDLITVSGHLKQEGTLDAAGGAHKIAELYGFPTASNLSTYIESIREKYVLRQIISIGMEMITRAKTHNIISSTPYELLDDLSRQITEISNKSTSKKRRTMRDLANDKIDRMSEDHVEAIQLRTGLRGIDSKSPISLGDMILVAGERKAGKSILALNIALSVSQKNRIAVFSLEDGADSLVDRIMSNLCKIPTGKHKLTGVTIGENSMLIKGIEILSSLNMQIYDDVYDLAAIVANIRREKLQHPDLAAIVIDYAQLVRFTGKKTDNREQIIATISRTLRLIGLELKVAIILLTQLNKDGETRESKALEQDCTAMFRVDKTGEDEDENTKRLISIPFQRNGQSGIAFPVSFRGEYALFTDCEDVSIHAPARGATAHR